jgi:hypothetical protein
MREWSVMWVLNLRLFSQVKVPWALSLCFENWKVSQSGGVLMKDNGGYDGIMVVMVVIIMWIVVVMMVILVMVVMMVIVMIDLLVMMLS